MASKEYYENWLQYKAELNVTLLEDSRIQQLAKALIGIKPQSTACNIVARVYCKYCNLYNKLCDVYDQMQQPQRQVYIKKIIDAVACRLLELKTTLEEIEVFEFTYSDNALVQMLMIPDNVQILCPFFYPFEIRQQEIQYIVDEIMAGNRLGDPTPTPSEIERREEARLEEEARIQEEKEIEIRRKIAMGEEIEVSKTEIVYTLEQLETMRREKEYNENVSNIQRMERSRFIIFHKIQKANKDLNLYLDLAGLRKPKAKETTRIRAAEFIYKIYRRFMELKREHVKDYQLRLKLEMIMPSFQPPPSAKIQLEKVKEVRRKFRLEYFQKWLDANVKEKSRILLFKEKNIFEDISTEVRDWFKLWYDRVKVFDEYPWPEEGGSILVVQGKTFSIDEYVEWRKVEEKRLQMEKNNPKTKEDIKAEKLAELEEKKRLEEEAKLKEQKRIIDYKKQRLSPDNDPGVYINVGNNDAVEESWFSYEDQWSRIDCPNPALDVIKGHILELIIENKYQEINLELRPLVDEMMRLELTLLKAALKRDYEEIKTKIPITKKRKRFRRPKPPKEDTTKPAVVFQKLVDAGIVVKYPRTTLEDYWGDRNYAAADERAIQWTPKFSQPCLGDIKEQIRIRCLLTLGADCPKMTRSQLFVGPRGSCKRTLAYAVATETNSILIDLSPYNVYNKLKGGKGLRQMMTLVNKVSRMMQPTVILVHRADKMFYKKKPKEEKQFNPTRLSRNLFKDIIKGLKPPDKVLVIGTADEPWLAKKAKLKKAFPQCILFPRSDYGSISYILSKILSTYHCISRDFNVQSLAQALRGFDINSIMKGVARVLNAKRVAELKYKPLEPIEIVNSVLADDNSVYTDDFDYKMFQTWYQSYSSFGRKLEEYKFILASQLAYKEKKEKNKKK